MTCPSCRKEFKQHLHQRYCSKRCKKEAFRAQFMDRTGMSYSWHQKHPTGTKREYQKVRHILPSEMRRWVKLQGGIYQTRMPGGRYWVAHLKVGADKRQRAFPIAKLGEARARLMATLQRMMWLLETGAWKPDDGDPLALLRYTDTFKGNRDYADSEVVDVESPYVAARER